MYKYVHLTIEKNYMALCSKLRNTIFSALFQLLGSRGIGLPVVAKIIMASKQGRLFSVWATDSLCILFMFTKLVSKIYYFYYYYYFAADCQMYFVSLKIRPLFFFYHMNNASLCVVVVFYSFSLGKANVLFRFLLFIQQTVKYSLMAVIQTGIAHSTKLICVISGD